MTARSSTRGHLAAGSSVALATLLAWLGSAHLAEPDTVMIYLVGISLVALRYGRGPAVLASALSVAAYDFFFVVPYFTFSVEEGRHLLTFAMMFAAGIVVSGAVARMHRQEVVAREAELRARAEEARSSLLSTFSHDLRTPLAAITGAASAVRGNRSRLSEEQQDELLETICGESDRLSRLVENVLDMTRIEAGSGTLRREWVPLEEMVGSALHRLEERLERHTVRTQLERGLPLLAVDAVLFEQVLVNLLDNAAKHTPPGTTITLRAGLEAAGLGIEVVDQGPGIPEDAQEKVFEKFYRAPGAAASGAGLGLSICRAVVEAHGGRISAANRPGGGLRVHIDLPLAPGPPSVPSEEELATGSRP